VGGSTVYRTKRRFVEGDLERALSEQPRPGAERKLTGKKEPCWWRPLRQPSKGPCTPDAQAAGGATVRLTEHNSLSHETARRC
jgi:hypothetical protein